MKTRLIFIFLFLVNSALLLAQPSTEVYLFDLHKEGNGYILKNPVNISDNPGYDNQPSFLPDGSAVLFTSYQDDQTDIIQYQVNTAEKKRLTQSDGSEYSPTVTPDGTHFTTIILEKDGTQLLWKYPLDGGKAEVAVPELKIGYHCWYDENTIVSFVLGEPATLQSSNVNTAENKILDSNIGRSLHKIPNENKVSYISKSNSTWMIRSLNPITGDSKNIIETLPNSEDMSWAPDGSIFMGQQSSLYWYDPKGDEKWQEVSTPENLELKNISRISVSPKGDKIALVIEE